MAAISVKFSQSYDRQQDRILLITEHTDGGNAKLWLTQRLANRLVSGLSGLLQRRDGEMPIIHHSAVQAWEQAAAVAQSGRHPPVVEKTALQDVLVDRIRLETNGRSFVVTMSGKGHSAVLHLTTLELRQWFNVLHDHYQAAEWPRTAWPAWMAWPTFAMAGAVSNAVN